MSLLGMVEGLDASGVSFVVVGGVAAVAHGSTRVTNDLDLCYETSPDNRRKLAKVLAGWNAYLREIEPGLPFIMDAQTLNTAEMLTLTTHEGDIDLLQHVPGVGGYDDCLAASEEVEVEGTRFRVLGLQALIDSKRATGRKKDIELLRELEALKELRDRST